MAILLVLLGSMAALVAYTYTSPLQEIDVRLDSSGEETRYTAKLAESGTAWENADKSSDQVYGNQYDGAIYNNTDSDFTDWSLTFDVEPGSYLDSQWNGEYTFSPDGRQLTLSSVDYNQTIPSHSSITFGFVMYSSRPGQFDTFDLRGATPISLFTSPLFWVIAALTFAMLVVMITSLIESIRYQRIDRMYKVSHEVTDQALRTFARIIDAKDRYTSGHSYRVALYSRMLAKCMGLSEEDQERIYYIGLLHDIGKIAISDSILSKESRLTNEEWALIKTHTTVGGSILNGFSAVPGIADGARYHHERYDGSGYAEGLKGEEIPLFARIIGVADAFDAMSSARCYRARLTKAAILEELKKGSGKQFDPAIVKHMIDLFTADIVPIKEASAAKDDAAPAAQSGATA